MPGFNNGPVPNPYFGDEDVNHFTQKVEINTWSEEMCRMDFTIIKGVIWMPGNEFRNAVQ